MNPEEVYVRFIGIVKDESNCKAHFWADRALYLGMGFEAGPHAHHALQISISLENSFPVRVSGSQHWSQFQSVLIHGDLPHQFMGLGQELAVLYIDYEASDAEAIREQLTSENGMTVIPYAKVMESIQIFRDNLEGTHSLPALHTACDEILESICDAKYRFPVWMRE
jgi:hypothetical protein